MGDVMSNDRGSQLESLSIDRGSDSQNGSSGGGLIGMAVALVLGLAMGGGAVWVLKPTPDVPASSVAQSSTPASSTQSDASQTQVAAPTRVRAPSGLAASGYVTARRQATVSAEITGRITQVLVEEGAEVEAGEILAHLDDTRARLDLERIEAQHRAANAQIAQIRAEQAEARRVLERAAQLAERNVGSEAQVTASRARLESLDAQLTAARANVSALDAQVASQHDYIERHVVRAPFAGVVIAKNAQVGEILSPVSAGGGFTRTGVATLVDMSSLEIEVDVNEGQIGRVEPGQRVEAILDAYPDWRIRAHVEAIIPTADRARATIQVRVAFDEADGRILPDMAARVTFIEPGS